MAQRKPLGSSSPTVLLLEDDEESRRVLTQRITESGFEVIAVPHTLLALAVLESGQRVDLLVANVKKSGGKTHGDPLVQTVRLRVPNLAIILTSADELDPASRAGSNKTLRKPFEIATLLDEIKHQIAALRAPSPVLS